MYFCSGYILKILYVKTKETGPLGGGVRRARPLDPPMYNELNSHYMPFVSTAIVETTVKIAVINTVLIAVGSKVHVDIKYNQLCCYSKNMTIISV